MYFACESQELLKPKISVRKGGPLRGYLTGLCNFILKNELEFINHLYIIEQVIICSV